MRGVGSFCLLLAIGLRGELLPPTPIRQPLPYLRSLSYIFCKLPTTVSRSFALHSGTPGGTMAIVISFAAGLITGIILTVLVAKNNKAKATAGLGRL